jgi:lactate permease
MFTQDFAPIAGSIGLSAIAAVLPLATVFVLLGVVRMRAHLAALAGLAVAILVAIAVYGMPAGMVFSGAVEGAAFGLLPILWIVVNALWIYRMTVYTGHFDVLRRSFGQISDDPRIQGLIVAFCFGALIEALAGFGAPVAICSVMLVALGFSPVRGAMVALVANTAPVAFGALATPVITLAKVTDLPLDTLASIVGRQTPLLAVFVPLALVMIIDGRRGLRETWMPALCCGLAFGIVQFLLANFVSAQLADIGAALAGAAVLAALPMTRRPASETVRAAVLTGAPAAPVTEQDSRSEVWRAYAPYLIIIVVFSVAQIPVISDALDAVSLKIDWPFLNVVEPSGEAASANKYEFEWLSTGGTLVLLSGVLTALALGVAARRAVREWAGTVHELRFAILTVTSVLAIAYVMNLSGQTSTIGYLLAGAGAALGFLSPVLGWFGVAVTGSDTSSNALFGALQVTAANQSGLSPQLLAAANSSGGVLGKMISPQNLTIACAAANLNGQEGNLLRKVLPWSLGLLALMCVIVFLQSTPVLGWMLP